MSRLNDAYRAERVLDRIEAGIPESAVLRREGSDGMFATTRARWREGFATARLKEVRPGPGRPRERRDPQQQDGGVRTVR